MAIINLKLFIWLLLPLLCISQTRLDSNWLNAYKVNDNTWTLRKHNLTCYAGRVLYPYGPECADLELSKDLTRSEKIHFGFNISFMGHQFDACWVNQHGFISFQESFYGQTMSQEDWPQPRYPYVDDPVFIAPLFAQTDLAGDKIEDVISTKYGRVLYKVFKRMDLPQIYTEEERFVYQMSMKILDEGQKDIRETVSSAENFIATYALIVTWKSVTFLGNSLTDIDSRPRNTFQLTILSNGNHTFAIFNYEEITWYAATSQGGNPETGTGGKAARIGFNRGNGTLWYGHKPFSENAQLMQTMDRYTNVGIPGRFIFRIDEWIQPAGCLNIDFESEKHLSIWPRSGNMLGGQEVNITGPCLDNEKYFHCRWGDWFGAPITIGEPTLIGHPLLSKTTFVSKLRGRCIQPLIYYNGRLNLSISLDGGKTFEWKTEYTIVDPLRYPAKVEMVNIADWHEIASPPRLIVKWDRFDLSWAEFDLVDIDLWGYYEDDEGPHWDFLQSIASKKINKGSYGFDVAPNRARNQSAARTYKLGAISISYFFRINQEMTMSKKIWTGLHPLGWWRNDEMKFFYDKKTFFLGNSRGRNWPEDQCRWWHEYRRDDRYWMDDLEVCPPTVFFAIGDMGVWAPDPSCNMYGDQYNEMNCLQHKEAKHCVVTMRRTEYGSGNRCCYDKLGNLMYTNDTSSGSTPDRYHSLGMAPYNVWGKVPALSHYFHDIVPYYLCCKWGDLCDTYLYARQTKDAKGYREPRMAVSYGDPHLITFDGKDYTFNAKGEFTLFKSKKHNFRLQARFEQPPNATYCLYSSKGQVNATRITAIAVGQDDSDIVEVRTRIYPHQTYDLRCDVIVNGRTYYLNYTEEKVQMFKNVFIVSPLVDRHQSNITIMFNSSGIGVQVECLYGMMHVRAAAPYSLFKETAGLFGYWDNITANDFMSPDGSTNQLTLKPDLLYQRFGMAWRLKDESESIFTYSGGWSFDTFHDNRPIIKEWQRFRPWFTTTEVPFPSNVTFTKEDWIKTCDGDEQCLYDAAAMGSLEIGESTKHAHRYYRFIHESMKSVNSCGIYLLKGGLRKTSTGNYLAGSYMDISCEPGYTLFGWDRFYCNWNGTWLPTNNMWLEQFRDWPYCEHFHITAIRYSAIVISSLWTLGLAAAVIYYFFFKRQQEYITDGKNDEYFEYVTPADENELNSFKFLEKKGYNRDGLESNGDLTKSVDNLNKKDPPSRKSSDEMQDAQLVPVDKLEKPFILVQMPNSRENKNKSDDNRSNSGSNNGSKNSSYRSNNENSYRPIQQQQQRANTPVKSYVNQAQFDNMSTITNRSNDDRLNRRISNTIEEEEPNNQEERAKQAQLLQKKQYENPYLQRMRQQQQLQQELIKQQLKNQNNINLDGIDSSV